MYKNYWRRVCREAARKAAHDLFLDTPGRFVVAGISIAGAIGALVFWGSADASRDETIVRVAIALVVVGLFPFFFVWNLIRLPAIWDQDQRLALAATDDRSAIRAELQAIFSRGRAMTDRRLPKNISDADMDAYVAETTSWVRQTETWIAQNLGAAAVAKFKAPNMSSTMGTVGVISERHDNVLTNMNKYLENIEILMTSPAYDKHVVA